MYNMYPDYSETTVERGAAGLGHYDGYPIEREFVAPKVEADQSPEAVSPLTEQGQQVRRVGHGAGLVSIKPMVME